MTIRSRGLAEATYSGAGTSTLYTAPANTRVRIREVAVDCTNGSSIVVSAERSSGATRPLVRRASTVGVTLTDAVALGTTLEPGDAITVTRSGASSPWRVWLSGTTYEDA